MPHAMIFLFAQQQKGGGGEAFAGVLVSVLVCCGGLLIFGASLWLVIWHLMAASKALAACSEDNRDMEPGMVYLFFIPGFAAIWHFFIVLRVASSLQKEFDERNLEDDGGDFGKTMGLWAVILNIVGCGFVGIVMLIMWTLKIKEYTRMLTQSKGKSKSKRRRSRDEDDDDDD